MGGIVAAMTGMAGCNWRRPFDQTGTETPEVTPTRGDTDPELQAALDGLVVPIAPGVGSGDAVDPATTSTPVADAKAAVDDVGEKEGFGAVLLPPTTIQEAEPVVPSEFMEFVGWGANTSTVEFTDREADGFRITHLKEGKFVRLDGFTISGSDRNERTGGSAIHFINDSGVSPKQFNIGNIAFRGWIDPVVHCELGSPFDSTWRHLDFGYDANNGREIVLGRRQSLLGTQIGYIGAGNATEDTVFWTDFAGAKVKIGFLNIGGSAGQAVRIKTGANGHVHIGGINFESTLSTDKPVVSLQGEASTRLDYVQNTNSEARSMVQLKFKNGNNIIGPLRNNGSLRVGKVEIRADAASPSYYFGSSTDVSVAPDVSGNIWAFGDMKRVGAETSSVAANPLGAVDTYSNVSADDLSFGEFAVDTNYADTGSVALLYKDEDGTLHRWDADTLGTSV